MRRTQRRLQDESGNATAIRPFPDPEMAVNLSVWRDAESLERFVISPGLPAPPLL